MNDDITSEKSTLPPLIMRGVCLVAGITLCFMTFLMPEKIDLMYGLCASGVLAGSGMFPAAIKKGVLMMPDFFSRIFSKTIK